MFVLSLLGALAFLCGLRRGVRRNSFLFHQYRTKRTVTQVCWTTPCLIMSSEDNQLRHIWSDILSWVTAPEQIATWRNFYECFERRKMYSFLGSALSFSRHSRFLFKNLGRSNFRCGIQDPLVPLQPGISLLRATFSRTLVHHWSRNHSYVAVRGFHTSQLRHAAPLAALLVKLAGPLSKVIKLVAVVGGR